MSQILGIPILFIAIIRDDVFNENFISQQKSGEKREKEREMLQK